MRVGKSSLLLTGLIIIVSSCKDKIINPIPSDDYRLCYEKECDGQWEIFTNNISGTNPQNISNYSGDDEYPQWSPDGRYIVYSRRFPSSIVGVVVYDTKTQVDNVLTTDSIDAGLTPKWTPDGKIFFYARSSYDVYDSGAMYVMNPDGSQKRKILDGGASIYFYNDGYNFLYIMNYTKVFKSNTNNTIGEFLFDINQTLNQQGTIIRDFNPMEGKLLISPNSVEGKSEIAAFEVSTRNLDILLTAEEGYSFFQMKYSSDFSKITFIEHSRKDEYLSVLENRVKKRLVRIPASDPPINFSYEPMEFSPEGNYIAFSNQIWHTGQWVSFSTPLFVVAVAGGAPYKLEDEAHGPSWDPQP